ncbi:MAG: glutathione ABC transporter permease GsiD [Candidatus Tectimicrobiota bacterium]|nr:MAG: glutathione ABC transporter permease GsiD [Candidatus Tectomicrobia bacterium]
MRARSATLTQVQVASQARPRKGPRWWLLARRNPAAAVSALVVMGIVLVALTAPWITPYDPYQPRVGPRLHPPSLHYPMGTDSLGRDMLSRIILGSQVALLVSTVSIALGVSLGTLIGLVSGWTEGLVDQALQRLIDAMMAIPGLVLAMALASVLGTGLDKVILALSIFTIPVAARTVRGTVLSAKTEAYVEAARALGASSTRLLFTHILPNTLAPIIVVVSIQIGITILAEAALSFVGLGVQPPTPSWGQLLSGAGRTYMERAPWLAIFPTVAISVTVLAFNFLGDGLRDILDPRLRGST